MRYIESAKPTINPNKADSPGDEVDNILYGGGGYEKQHPKLNHMVEVELDGLGGLTVQQATDLYMIDDAQDLGDLYW